MEFQTTKRDLETVFTRIQNQVAEANLPDEESVNRLVRLARKLHQLADEDWVDEAEDFSHLAGQLLNAVKKGDVEDCVMLVESLDDAQSFCHRMFRD
ncbi:MAG: GAK system XXXCH domain-containing protein [Solidesulfovibrio sp.]|uniref:GAK system XXXCH domain-containing protein n=1 Tax=Solidesulfovibrio sp. TaxID=2910990 RepID=UPI002B1FA0D1|nr:GAK system XXXCH domain-containing protein [Solidesulfovibrio sp.]MEA4857486.1 GAK system XXXCH domain-containing protein [Solidesulfovibrio sp.]